MIPDDYLPYEDRFGLIHWQRVNGQRDPSSGNGLLTTSIFYALRKLRGEQMDSDRLAFHSALTRCEKEFGLLRRSPSNDDQEGIDDYLGVLAASVVLGSRLLPQAICLRGKRFRPAVWGPLRWPWFYNNETPGTIRHRDGRINWSAWLGRHPSFVPLVRLSAGETLGCLDWTRLSATIWWGTWARKTDQDAWMLTWLLIQAIWAAGREHPDHVDSAIGLWWKTYEKKLGPGGLGQIYIGDPEHPIRKFWVDKKL
jgi:hypothetical protein